jgi:CubicO group peptidase (beta-lactamase class C family)
VARPLGADLHFGVDDPVRFARIARVRPPTVRDWARDLPKVPGGLWRKVLNPVSLLHRAGREILSVDPGDPDWIRLPFPSANAVGTTRAVAALYAEVAAGGARLGLTPSVVDDLLAAPEIPPGGSRDRVMGVDGRWRLGFVRPGPAFAFSPSPRAFGMPGLGGSFGFADPDEGLAYCFAPAGLGVLPFDEPREQAIRAAVLKAARKG